MTNWKENWKSKNIYDLVDYLAVMLPYKHYLVVTKSKPDRTNHTAAKPPSEEIYDGDDDDTLTSIKQDSGSEKLKKQPNLESQMITELNKTASNDSIWTKEGISNWMEGCTNPNQSWSMEEMVQDMDTKSASPQNKAQKLTRRYSCDIEMGNVNNLESSTMSKLVVSLSNLKI